MKRYFREWSVFFAFLAILLLLAFRAPDFFQPAQLLSMLCDAVPVLVTACGMTLVIIWTGGEQRLADARSGSRGNSVWRSNGRF